MSDSCPCCGDASIGLSEYCAKCQHHGCYAHDRNCE